MAVPCYCCTYADVAINDGLRGRSRSTAAAAAAAAAAGRQTGNGSTESRDFRHGARRGGRAGAAAVGRERNDGGQRRGRGGRVAGGVGREPRQHGGGGHLLAPGYLLVSVAQHTCPGNQNYKVKV